MGAAEGTSALHAGTSAATPLHAAPLLAVPAFGHWWLDWPLAQESSTCATSCSTADWSDTLDGGPTGSEPGGAARRLGFSPGSVEQSDSSSAA
eukprot:scaffold137171_cov105-Phaeocystis_antarctica.AAC.1